MSNLPRKASTLKRLETRLETEIQALRQALEIQGLPEGIKKLIRQSIELKTERLERVKAQLQKYCNGGETNE